MATNTYVALDKIVLSSSTSTVSFTSIDQSYTDLILVAAPITAIDGYGGVVRVNGDTSSIYSTTELVGNGSSAASYRYTNESFYRLAYYAAHSTTANSNVIIHFQNYSNTTTYKTVIARANSAAYAAQAAVGLWRSTAAINRIDYVAGTMNAGSTFTLYGIKSWTPEVTPKATGGYVYSDSTYYYHAFPFSGTFTPVSTLSCDVLVVAGGGGGGYNFAAGGGAGGLRAFTSQSVSTAQTVTIGSGGAGAITTSAASSANGGNTSFGSLAVTGGGGGGNANTNSAGASGGSGGGGGYNTGGSSGGTGNSGSYSPVEGYAGGAGNGSGSGGGGGASAVGVAGSGSSAGGAGTDTYNSINFSTWLSVTGLGSSAKLAGGGGAGNSGTAGVGGGGTGGANAARGSDAVVSTGGGGGGGGGSSAAGGNGGSGLVIVRYAK